MQSISAEDIVQRIKQENPWWSSKGQARGAFQGWEPRSYFNLFYPLVRDRSIRRAVVLMGPRRVGKTVMIHKSIQRLLDEGVAPNSICYFSVDHPIYSGLSIEKLLGHYSSAVGIDFRSHPVYVFLDEIQYLRDWEIHLKVLVDSFPDVKTVASRSAAAALRLKSHESGAGRFTDFLLPPLTFHEYLQLLKREDLIRILPPSDSSSTAITRFEAPDIDALNREFVKYINIGGYPEVVLSPRIQEDPARFIKSDIIDKVLLRDWPRKIQGVN